MLGELSPAHLIIIAVVFMILFGAKKLPEASRSLGRSLRILKAEVNALHDGEEPGQGSASRDAVGATAARPAVRGAATTPAVAEQATTQGRDSRAR